MSSFLMIGEGGMFDAERVVAVGRASSAPIKRLLETYPQVLNLTYGYPRQTVLLLDNGFLAVVSISIEQLCLELKGKHIEIDDSR